MDYQPPQQQQLPQQVPVAYYYPPGQVPPPGIYGAPAPGVPPQGAAPVFIPIQTGAPVASPPPPPGTTATATPRELGEPQMRVEQHEPTARRGHGGWGEQDWDIPPEKLLNESLDRSIRHGFIRKVYGILTVQLIITFGIAAAFNLSTTLKNWSYDNWWMTIILAFMMLAFIIALVCVPGLGRKVPINYILLTGFTITVGFMLGWMAACVDTWAFSMAAGVTAAVVLALTLFAFQTKWDFTGCGTFGFVAIMILILFGIIAAFAHNYIMDMVYGCLGALIFSFYLIYDTQKIVGGKHHKFQYSVDDYCFAALSLYMDIVNLFSYMLTIMAAADH